MTRLRTGEKKTPIFFLFDPVFCLFPPLRKPPTPKPPEINKRNGPASTSGNDYRWLYSRSKKFLCHFSTDLVIAEISKRWKNEHFWIKWYSFHHKPNGFKALKYQRRLYGCKSIIRNRISTNNSRLKPRSLGTMDWEIRRRYSSHLRCSNSARYLRGK